MKKSDLFRQWFSRSCVWYTAIATVLLLFKVLLDGIGDGQISVLSFLLFLPCAMTASAADEILRCAPLSHAARLFLHFFLILTGFYLFLWLPGHTQSTFSRHLGFLICVTLVYWIGYLIIRLCVHRFRSAPEEKI